MARVLPPRALTDFILTTGCLSTRDGRRLREAFAGACRCVVRSRGLRRMHAARLLPHGHAAQDSGPRVPFDDTQHVAPLPSAVCTRTHHALGQPSVPEAPGQSKADSKKQMKAMRMKKKSLGSTDRQEVPGWELTVGIEIHAQLNTSHKLFSPALTAAAATASEEDSVRDDDVLLSHSTAPNSLVAPFDLAMPGSQPVFQPATLIPAIRAALALNCEVQKTSSFDRKHYFHWDQPAGYQITQFYRPLAVRGHVDVLPRDGAPPQEFARTSSDDFGDGNPRSHVRVRIKQIQMEQDTAKTVDRPGGVRWVDFNRAGSPLIEIISEPDIHYPATAAAFVRKVQMLLESVDACVIGMELGGLRADVNVSVRRANAHPSVPLGQRTEIKNLSSFKAVEDAVIAERDRQIELLEAGGVVQSETRGWEVGGTETRLLRKKEGEVDYRYMPDPDIPPVIVADEVLKFLRESIGTLPDQELDELIRDYGLTDKDAMSLMLLDKGGRLEFFYRVVDALEARIGHNTDTDVTRSLHQHRILAANWVLHVLGSLTSANNNAVPGYVDLDPRHLEFTPDGHCNALGAQDLADVIFFLHRRRITLSTAKDLLFALFREEVPGSSSTARGSDVSDGPGAVEAFITARGLWFVEVPEATYRALAEAAIDSEEEALRRFLESSRKKQMRGKRRSEQEQAVHEVAQIRERNGKANESDDYPLGKQMFLVGKMLKSGGAGGGGLDPATTQRVVATAVRERLAALKKEMWPDDSPPSRVHTNASGTQ